MCNEVVWQAGVFAAQRKWVEAEAMLQTCLAIAQRTLPPADPQTLSIIDNLELTRREIRKSRGSGDSSKGRTIGGATGTSESPGQLAAGTRVLVQGLVSKPEYNGKGARVLSFDGFGKRYVVALDDGQELSLKPECVVMAAPEETILPAGTRVLVQVLLEYSLEYSLRTHARLCTVSVRFYPWGNGCIEH
jgi:hypothetical protein